MSAPPKIAIIYVSYHAEPYLEDVATALESLTYDRRRLELVVVDNPHPEHGDSLAAIERVLRSRSATSLPHVTVLPQGANGGFSRGVNAGVEWALREGFDYVYLHNDDGVLAPDALEPLVEELERNPEVGIAQSLILLHPETHLINTAGNELHYCFVGYCGDYRRPSSEVSSGSVRDVPFASGAGCLIRSDTLRECGAFDEDLFLYCEDLEFCCRVRLAGQRVVTVAASKFYHRYEFARAFEKFYWLERNRYAVMLKLLRLPTLALLFPAALFLEIGLFFFAWRSGWLRERLRVYRYWTRAESWRTWWGKRRSVRSLRRRPDRELLAVTSGRLELADAGIAHPLLRWIGNPILSLYYRAVVRPLVRW